MRAVNGYLENGRFTPLEVVSLPRRVKAMLVYDDSDTVVDEAKDKEARLSLLDELRKGSEGIR